MMCINKTMWKQDTESSLYHYNTIPKGMCCSQTDRLALWKLFSRWFDNCRTDAVHPSIQIHLKQFSSIKNIQYIETCFIHCNSQTMGKLCVKRIFRFL